ncbi:MAG TPA: AMP-binding protein [Streptosporangiaceae bacterium]|nr:AMP-binding protein [Streptosporangiaceae bacterium]
MREYTSPACVEIPAPAGLTDVIFRRARTEPGVVMLRKRTGAGRWQDVTAAQFRAEVAALAKGLVAAGIEPGDRVALMSRTRYEWTLIDYAIWAAGAVSVPVYETSSAEQVAWTLSDSAALAVFAETSAHEEIISSVRGKLPGMAHVWMIGALDALASGGTQITADQLEQRRTGRSAADPATIIYTSGTTGRPKGCEVTHGNLLADVRSAVSALPEIFGIPGCSTLLFLPLAHAFARIIQVGCLEAGAILGHWPDTATLAEGLTEFRPTFLLAVPRVFEKLYDAAWQQASASAARTRIFAAAAETAIDWSKAMGGAASGGSAGPALRLRHALYGRLVYGRLRAAVGGRVQYAVSGGAPLGERLGHFFRGCGITVLEGYGLTETSGAATVNRPGHNKIGTVGQPLPGVAIRIADDGEILLRGQNVFPGYWHDPAASAGVLDHEGWLHTGDIGALDEEGFLRVTGRKKELIITAGGQNVAPEPLEDRLRAHWLVSQCMVVGEGRPYIACLVTLDPQALESWERRHGRAAGAAPAELASDPRLIAEIQLAVDEANKAVSRAESIRRFRILGTDFTEAAGQLTPSFKVRRDVVAKHFAADIEALYNQGGLPQPATAQHSDARWEPQP